MSEETVDIPEQNYGPGNVLRAKREEYEWSVEAVAEALHLSTHSVKAIEADRYEDLPGATYVIGYWRSYARLLGIDIEETIDVNKRNLSIVTSEAAGLDINRAYGQKVKPRGKGGLILLILLAALAYYAWQQQFFGLIDVGMNSEESTVTNITPQPKQVPESIQASSVTRAEQVLRPLKVEKATPPATSSGEAATKGGDKPGSASSNSVQSTSGLVLKKVEIDQPASKMNPQTGTQKGLVLAQQATSSAASSDETNTNLLQAQTAPTPPATSSADTQAANTASDAATATPNASGLETMTLTLSKDSWLDIRDKTRKRLLYKTEKAGQKVEVTGHPPFYVYIGTPDGVSIQYRGKTVPFETHKTGMFARFKLDDKMLESL